MPQRTAGDVLRAYYAALDAPRLDDLDGILAPELEWRFPGTLLTTPAQVKRAMARSLATGLVMQHDIGHLLDHGDRAICELVATNRLPAGEFRVAGAVVCEARDGRITRLAAYPEAEQLRAFLAALWGAGSTERGTPNAQ
jgi:ketosteroid isomerase-like protein